MCMIQHFDAGRTYARSRNRREIGLGTNQSTLRQRDLNLAKMEACSYGDTAIGIKLANNKTVLRTSYSSTVELLLLVHIVIQLKTLGTLFFVLSGLHFTALDG